MMKYEQLRLSNQVCFPVYAASRLITREYQPYLDELGITYPQYLVMMVLWETDSISVNQIAKRLILNTNTITPLLKRMESMGLLIRKRSDTDERKVMVCLTPSGYTLQSQAATIPEKLLGGLQSGHIEIQKLIDLRESLNYIIHMLNKDQGS